jgi:S1-C subfamily serine protease
VTVLARTFMLAAFLASVILCGTGRGQAQTVDEDAVRRIEYLLLWSGHYAQPVSGWIQTPLLNAIKAFQKDAGYRPTGVLDSDQIARLVARAETRIARDDYAYLPDSATGAFLALPRKTLTERTSSTRGTRYAAPNRSIVIETARYDEGGMSLVQIYKSYLEITGHARILQNAFRGDDFSVATTNGNIVQMRRVRSDGDELKGLTIRFDKAADPDFLPTAYAMINDFSPSERNGTPAYLSAPEIAQFPPPSFHSGSLARAPRSSGSGFIVALPDMVLTNAHVVKDCTQVIAGKDMSARLIAVDAIDDLALLQVPRLEAAKAAVFTSEPVLLGTEVAAFGFPLRGILADQLNMTTGIVSALAGPGGNAKFIQISAAVQPGNSGGPLVDLSGRTIGIVTSRLRQVSSRAGVGDEEIQLVNFAVRQERATTFLRQAGVEPRIAAPAAVKSKTELAGEVAAYTIPILCYRQ